MNDSYNIDLVSYEMSNQPFPHFYSLNALTNKAEFAVFDWLNNTDSWTLMETDFYNQHEFNLLNADLPDDVQFLISENLITNIERKFIEAFAVSSLDLVGIIAHKLVDGQRIGIHNDFINDEETHRLVLHFNPDWNEDNGGYLMLFNSAKADDVAKVFSPLNNFAFGFEISAYSHHAVSRIYDFSRYTIVYTFTKR